MDFDTSSIQTPPSMVTDDFTKQVLFMYGVPSLTTFARRVLFKDLGLSVPEWNTMALRQNVILGSICDFEFKM